MICGGRFVHLVVMLRIQSINVKLLLGAYRKKKDGKKENMISRVPVSTTMSFLAPPPLGNISNIVNKALLF